MLSKIIKFLFTPFSTDIPKTASYNAKGKLIEFLNSSYLLHKEDTIDAITIRKDVYHKLEYIPIYSQPLPVGYGANQLKITYLIGDCPEYKDVQFYLPSEDNRYCGSSAHDKAILLYKPIKSQSILLSYEDILDNRLLPELQLNLLVVLERQIYSQIKVLEKKYYNDANRIPLYSQLDEIQHKIDKFRNTRPELFI